MAVLTKALTTIGLVLLAHAVYSTYEHTLILNSSRSNKQQIPSASLPASLINTTKAPLPLDIRLETILSTLLLLGAIVISAPPLRSIRWREWAGRIEREGWDPAREGRGTDGSSDATSVKGGKGNPYAMVEARKGFWDIRAARKEFANWVREGAEIS